jgi:hypothetical protein
MRAARLVLAAAALAAAAAPSIASADPIPGDPPPIYTFCTVHWKPMPIFTDDVPVTPYQPYFVC